jgi:hypothetical protein
MFALTRHFKAVTIAFIDKQANREEFEGRAQTYSGRW